MKTMVLLTAPAAVRLAGTNARVVQAIAGSVAIEGSCALSRGIDGDWWLQDDSTDARDARVALANAGVAEVVCGHCGQSLGASQIRERCPRCTFANHYREHGVH